MKNFSTLLVIMAVITVAGAAYALGPGLPAPEPSPVPEPATLGLLGSALAGLFFFNKKNRRS